MKYLFLAIAAAAILLPTKKKHAPYRKPAVEPRVYLESPDAKSGFVYYDYADQKSTREQRLPARN